MTEGVIEEAEKAGEGSNTESNINVAKLPMFNENTSKIGEFITVYRLYLRMKMREAIVEEQIQWILLYIIYAERVSRCMEREFVRRFGIRRSRIRVSREIFIGHKKRIWGRK